MGRTAMTLQARQAVTDRRDGQPVPCRGTTPRAAPQGLKLGQSLINGPVRPRIFCGGAVSFEGRSLSRPRTAGHSRLLPKSRSCLIISADSKRRKYMAARTRPVRQPKDFTVELTKIDQRYRTARTVVRVAGVVLAVYFGGNILAPLAGEETALSLGISLLADLKLSVAITLAGAACAWAVVERALRHRKTEYLQKRIRELETMIDPNRSSSGLTEEGKTNPIDKVK